MCQLDACIIIFNDNNLYAKVFKKNTLLVVSSVVCWAAQLVGYLDQKLVELWVALKDN